MHVYTYCTYIFCNVITEIKPQHLKSHQKVKEKVLKGVIFTKIYQGFLIIFILINYYKDISLRIFPGPK